jgi:hypothetical protein
MIPENKAMKLSIADRTVPRPRKSPPLKALAKVVARPRPTEKPAISILNKTLINMSVTKTILTDESDRLIPKPRIVASTPSNKTVATAVDMIKSIEEIPPTKREETLPSIK